MKWGGLGNHYHAIIETPDANLSRGMRQLNGVYTQAFNRAHQRVGHVFQGRYKAIVVEKDSHLLELCRYVVLNPVRAGMVSAPEKWRWSSYKSTAYTGQVPDYLTIDWVLGQFSEEKIAARRRYRQFVADGLTTPVAPWATLAGTVFLGSEDFVLRMRDLLGGKQTIKEIPRSQRYPGRPLPEKLFAGLDAKDRQQRNTRVVEAHIIHGYTLKESLLQNDRARSLAMRAF